MTAVYRLGLLSNSFDYNIYNQTIMKATQPYTAVIAQDTATGYYVGYVPDLPGAHTQAETLEELQQNLREVVELVLEGYDPKLKPESHFVGTQLVTLQFLWA